MLSHTLKAVFKNTLKLPHTLLRDLHETRLWNKIPPFATRQGHVSSNSQGAARLLTSLETLYGNMPADQQPKTQLLFSLRAQWR